jgi:hypothetical protein
MVMRYIVVVDDQGLPNAVVKRNINCSASGTWVVDDDAGLTFTVEDVGICYNR